MGVLLFNCHASKRGGPKELDAKTLCASDAGVADSGAEALIGAPLVTWSVLPFLVILGAHGNCCDSDRWAFEAIW
jgi:hypothetical protein